MNESHYGGWIKLVCKLKEIKKQKAFFFFKQKLILLIRLEIVEFSGVFWVLFTGIHTIEICKETQHWAGKQCCVHLQMTRPRVYLAAAAGFQTKTKLYSAYICISLHTYISSAGGFHFLYPSNWCFAAFYIDMRCTVCRPETKEINA